MKGRRAGSRAFSEMIARKDTRSSFGPARMMKFSANLAVMIYICLISGFVSVDSAACPSYTGYIAVTDASHSGDTITTFTSADDALTGCNARDDCRGFTSSGELKSKAFPMSAKNGSCLYTKVDMMCSVIKGYWAAMDSDVKENTIASYTNSNDAEAACSTDPSCLGFNSRGQTKSRSMPLITSRRTCFYTKLSTVCQSLQPSKYYVLPDFNSNGGLLSTTASVDQSLQSCSSNNACSGVNSLKQSKAAGPLKSARGTCFYVKRQTNGTVCGAVPPGYMVSMDYDTAGGNMSKTPSNMNAPDAAKACDADTACRGFSRQNGFVVLKNSTSTLNYARKTCLFIKNDNIACQAYAGYRAEPNTNHEGDTIKLVSSALEAFKECEKDESCEGFSSKGVTKKLARPLTISRGTCFYQKLQVGCVKQYGYNAISDATIKGNDIATFSLDTSLQTPLTDVRDACNADPDCKGYTSAVTAKTAVTKTAAFPLVYARQQCFYSKAPTETCKDIDGYLWIIDYDAPEDETIGVYTSLTDAAAACSTDASCLGVNSRGETKSTTIAAYYHGVCFYFKARKPPTPPSPPLPTGVMVVTTSYVVNVSAPTWLQSFDASVPLSQLFIANVLELVQNLTAIFATTHSVSFSDVTIDFMWYKGVDLLNLTTASESRRRELNSDPTFTSASSIITSAKPHQRVLEEEAIGVATDDVVVVGYHVQTRVNVPPTPPAPPHGPPPSPPALPLPPTYYSPPPPTYPPSPR